MEKELQNQYPSIEQLQTELNRERYKARYNRTLRSTVYMLVVAAAVAVLLASLFFPVFRIYGNSMSPTVNEGELVVSLKGSHYACGDVLVLSYNNKLLVKRAIAGPGQWVDIDSKGNVYVDGKLIDEPYLSEKAFGDCTLDLPYQVPDERYFVMGDNRGASLDSRNASVGCIAGEQIIGKAILKIWPLNEIAVLNSNESEC